MSIPIRQTIGLLCANKVMLTAYGTFDVDPEAIEAGDPELTEYLADQNTLMGNAWLHGYEFKPQPFKVWRAWWAERAAEEALRAERSAEEALRTQAEEALRPLPLPLQR
jgi:hypothetical protein